MPREPEVPGERISGCRSCGSADLPTTLDLGPQPAADHFPDADDPGPDPRWPIELCVCDACGLAQLAHRSPPEEPPKAVFSSTASQHAHDMAALVMSRLGLRPGATVREFASSHGGHWIEALTAQGLSARPTGPVDAVVDNLGLIHSEDFATDLDARLSTVGAGGSLIVEFNYLPRLLAGLQFDTFRHGHPLYLTVTSFQRALAVRGFAVLDAVEVDVYGGCVVLFAARADEGRAVSPAVDDILAREAMLGVDSTAAWSGFAEAVERCCADLHAWLLAQRRAGRAVLGYGAPSKASLQLSAAGVTAEVLPMTADLSPAKHGRRVSGSDVRIVSPEELRARRPDAVLIVVWDLAAEIVRSFADLQGEGTEFYVGIPEIRRVG